MRPDLIVIAVAATAITTTCGPAVARGVDRRSSAAAGPKAPATAASQFYPQEIDGGVTGNLPFNNQIRKLKDPLNANGGK